MRSLIALVMIGAIISGCTAPPSDANCPTVQVSSPPIPSGYLHQSDGQTMDWPLLATDPGHLTLEAKSASMVLGRVGGPASMWMAASLQGQGPARLMHGPPGCPAQDTGIAWDLPTTATRGAESAVGAGVLVYTAGFYENGTMFYTNIKEVHDSDWPRASWYAWSGDAVLPVYVYERDTSEQPAQWKGAARNAAPLAPGSPVDGQAMEAAGTADGALGTGYSPTIAGFNEALKGMATTDLETVWIAPEDAYTREGAEDHPLYGQALVFVIKTVAVADQPCPPAAMDVPTCFRS